MNSEDSQRSRNLTRNFALVTLVMGLVVVVDQITKAMVLNRLGPDGDLSQVKIIAGFLRLIYVENTGAAFGMFQGKSPVLTVLALVVIGFLLVYFRRSIANSLWLSIALGLQLGGALGNVVDRFRHGFVVDFINIPRWPTFNVADSAITVGVFMLGFFLLTRDLASPDTDEKEARSSQQSSTDVSSAEKRAQ
ncbi:MAG: signal peptidase II [Nitrolancea sp.]